MVGCAEDLSPDGPERSPARRRVVACLQAVSANETGPVPGAERMYLRARSGEPDGPQRWPVRGREYGGISGGGGSCAEPGRTDAGRSGTGDGTAHGDGAVGEEACSHVVTHCGSRSGAPQAGGIPRVAKGTLTMPTTQGGRRTASTKRRRVSAQRSQQTTTPPAIQERTPAAGTAVSRLTPALSGAASVSLSNYLVASTASLHHASPGASRRAGPAPARR